MGEHTRPPIHSKEGQAEQQKRNKQQQKKKKKKKGGGWNPSSGSHAPPLLLHPPPTPPKNPKKKPSGVHAASAEKAQQHPSSRMYSLHRFESASTRHLRHQHEDDHERNSMRRVVSGMPQPVGSPTAPGATESHSAIVKKSTDLRREEDTARIRMRMEVERLKKATLK